MHTHHRRWVGWVASLLLLAAYPGASRADTPSATPGFERTEVAALRIVHRDFQRPARVLVRAGEMATVDFDGRDVGLRVLMLDSRSATIEVTELERLQAIGPGKNPEYREARVVERLLVAPGRAAPVEAFGIEIAYTIDELIRTPSVEDCPADPAGSKDLGSGDRCCLRCRHITICGSCVMAECGSCCAP